jgi:hypothetical protein
MLKGSDSEPFLFYKIFIDMKTKLIITESQFKKIKSILSENTMHSRMVKEMKDFLDANYTPTENYMREGGEYFGKAMFKVNADEELISAKQLYEYMSYKFGLGEVFTKQVIKDWVSGNIGEDFMLSKHVPMR